MTTPAGPTPAPPASAALVAAEAAELVERDYAHAARLYADLLAEAGPAERPVFVHRLARTYRKAGRTAEALARFRELQATTQPIGVLPADLIGSSTRSVPPRRSRFSATSLLLARANCIGISFGDAGGSTNRAISTMRRCARLAGAGWGRRRVARRARPR